MSKFSIQMTVSLEVSRTVEAESMEEAIAIGRQMETTCPVQAKLIKIAPRAEYLWNNESKLNGVTAS